MSMTNNDNIFEKYDIKDDNFITANKIYPDSSTLLNNYGIYCKQNKKNYDLAEKYYKLAIDKKNITALTNLGILYTEIKKYDLAKKYFKKGIKKKIQKQCFNLV